MSHDPHFKLLGETCAVIFGNVTLFTLSQFNVLMGSILSTASFLYLIWKWRNEYKNSKNNDQKGSAN
jgi:hypothetical protein